MAAQSNSSASESDPADKGDKKDRLHFLMLLNMTPQGRVSVVETAADKLDAAEKILEKIGGKVVMTCMTFGQYDGFIAGYVAHESKMAAIDGVMNFAAWVNEQGFFSTQTIIGANPKSYTRGKHN
jgi:uncharacterized protein with GYD domain